MNCRTYEEILDLAACKSSKLANTLSSEKDLYYVMTWQKSKAYHEWTKLIYAIVDNKNGVFNNFFQGDIQFIKFLVILFKFPMNLLQYLGCVFRLM